jgi:hypothetical protein
VFVHAWLVIGAVGLLGAVTALGMSPRRSAEPNVALELAVAS